jgi:hypothetical protein
MIAAGFVVAWFGYTYIIYGVSLLHGWNITWKQLANPLNPYQWPAKGTEPPLIPAGQILPGGTSTTAATGSGQSGGQSGSGRRPPVI